jgi:branched-chain amino acid transport system substrate-binding protein
MKNTILCLVVLSMVLLVGCAGQGNKIGFIGPLTGDAAFVGVPIKQTVELAAEELGMDVVYEDGGCNGKDALSAFMKLRDVDKVDAVVVVCSPELLAIAPVADGITIISPSATAPSITEAGDHVFRLVPSDALQGKVGAEILKDFDKVGMLYVNHDYGVGLRDVVESELGDIPDESFEPDAKDFKTQLTKLKDMDAIYLVGFPKDVAIILKQATELGMDVQFVAAEAAKDAEILPYADGIWITVPVSKGTGFEEFAEKYVAKFGEEPKLYAGETYDTMNVLAMGIDTVESYDGVAGFVTFDANGDVEKPYELFTVEDGKFVKV